jgi:hypothetical protein
MVLREDRGSGRHGELWVTWKRENPNRFSPWLSVVTRCVTLDHSTHSMLHSLTLTACTLIRKSSHTFQSPTLWPRFSSFNLETGKATLARGLSTQNKQWSNIQGIGIGIGIFNDNVDENQSTTNHDGIQHQGMRPSKQVTYTTADLHVRKESLDTAMPPNRLKLSQWLMIVAIRFRRWQASRQAPRQDSELLDREYTKRDGFAKTRAGTGWEDNCP